MNYATQIVESFKASVVERILVVDDAYDPPDLSEESQGQLLEILQREDLRDHVREEWLDDEELEVATNALVHDDFDHEAVDKAISALFRAYVDERATAVDPNGAFDGLKGSVLEALEPLLELLGRCDQLDIQRAGKSTAIEVYKQLRPAVILMDFFLSPPEQSDRKADADRKRSIESLKSILEADPDATPAVILMSSEDVKGRAQRYRRRLEGRVTALRFGFLNKKWIRGRGDALEASGDAADVLMDTAGGFEFGRTLEAAMRQWKEGAHEGLKQLYEDLREFEAKDFAYLLRFRLYEEGEPFADYLEWFLGESLRAIVDDQVKWNTDEFSQLNDKRLTEAIEGAHPVPSPRIAEFFHRMRFNSRENRARKRFALGDLFIASNNRNVRMLITPDCDMVVRSGHREASRLLSVGGTIRGLGDVHASAGDLILRGTPKEINWKFKDVMTHEFGDDLSVLLVDGTKYSYFASLRGMPAQTIQKRVLADLSRVGWAVPPTVDVSAPVKVYVKKFADNQAQVVELDGFEAEHAQVFLPRGGADKWLRVLFTGSFVRDLVARVEEMDENELLLADRQHRKDWIDNSTKVRSVMLQDGLELSGKWNYGMAASVGPKRGKNWLEVVVDVSDEALLQLNTADPLARY